MLAATSLIFVFGALLGNVHGHGMMLDPPNRSSLWRFDASAPKNYNDNQNFCGGYKHQWEVLNGNCGVCGDPYDDDHPQLNENTGFYGKGKVTKTYSSGSNANISILLTSNHLGNFKYSLCVLNDVNAPESGEECFQSLQLADGSDQYNVSKIDYQIQNVVKLPDGLTCERCVLRWHYTAGNNWGICANGQGALGCGPQETFRSCSDIAIV